MNQKIPSPFLLDCAGHTIGLVSTGILMPHQENPYRMEFGGEVLAADFIVNKASEGLSRIIETAMSDLNMHRRPTLAMVRDAMANGLTARLVGDGTLDPDEDGTLLGEIDGLIVKLRAFCKCTGPAAK